MRLEAERLNKAVLSKGVNVCFYVNRRNWLGGLGRARERVRILVSFHERKDGTVIAGKIDSREMPDPLLKQILSVWPEAVKTSAAPASYFPQFFIFTVNFKEAQNYTVILRQSWLNIITDRNVAHSI